MSNVKDAQIDTTVWEACPKCGSDEYARWHHAGDMLVPECWWWNCDDCGYATEPE